MRPFIDAQEQWSRYFQRVIALCPLSQPLLKPLSLDQRRRRGEEEGGGRREAEEKTRAVQIVPFESSYLPGNKSIRKIWTDGTKMRILVRYIATLQKSHNPSPIIDSLTPLDAQASLAPFPLSWSVTYSQFHIFSLMDHGVSYIFWKVWPRAVVVGGARLMPRLGGEVLTHPRWWGWYGLYDVIHIFHERCDLFCVRC